MIVPQLLLAALLQADSKDTAEDLVRQILESKYANVANDFRNKLQTKGDAAQKAIREALGKRYEGRPDPVTPAELVRRLDGLAVLDLQEYGSDALDALEAAAKTAPADRLILIQRLIQAIRLREGRGSPSYRYEPLYDLLNQMTAKKLPGDEVLLIKVLVFEPPSLSKDHVITYLRYLPLTRESLPAILTAADLRPVSIGRPLWSTLADARFADEPDWAKLHKEGGSVSRPLAAFRLKDPVLYERAFDEASTNIRQALLGSLLNFPADADVRTALVTRILTRYSADPHEAVRNSVFEAVRQNNLDAPDLLLSMLLSETESSRHERLIDAARRSKTPASEEILRRILGSGRGDLIPKLAPLFNPARHKALIPLLVAAYEKAADRDRRTIGLVLARFDHEIGIRQIESDLKSSNLQDVQAALDAILQNRLTRFGAPLWAMLQNPNGQVAEMARSAAVLLGAKDHPAEVREILSSDARVRDSVSRILRESGGPADLPMAVVLARSSDYWAQEAALTVLERMQITESNEALAALRDSPHQALSRRVDALLGKFEYPTKLPEILVNLTALDARKRSDAAQKYAMTDRKDLQFRIVDGPAAMKEKIVDVPVEVLRSLVADSNPAADDIFRSLVPGPVPASLTDPTILTRGSPDSLIQRLVRRGDKDDVRRLYTQGVKTPEAGALLQYSRDAREIDPEAVDAFFTGWLLNPPAGARRDVISNVLAAGISALPAARSRELLLALFRDERPEVHQAPVDIVRKRPELAFPAEAAADFRQGKVKEKHRLYILLGSVRSPEGEALLREWLKDPAAPVRVQSAAALTKLLKADAIPVLGDVLFEWFAQNRWWVLADLTQGIKPAHREALQAMLAAATDEQKPLLEVLLYVAGVDAERDRFIALYPEDPNDRRPFLLALEQRQGPVDDALIESILRIDKPLRSTGLYLKLLQRSDTVKAAELAKFIMETSYRQNLGFDAEFGPASEFLVRRLKDPPFELIAHYSSMSGSGPGAVRALASVGTEPAVAQLIRVAARSMVPQVRDAVAKSLRTAKRYPELQKEARAVVANAVEGVVGGSFVTVLPYLEGDPDSLDLVLGLLTRPNLAPVLRLPLLQTALTIPDSAPKLDGALKRIPRDLENTTSLLPETYRVIVKGEAPSQPAVQDGQFGYRLLLAAWARDRESVAKIVLTLSPGSSYWAVRALVETAANRSLPQYQDALRWAKTPGRTPTPESMAAELKALGVDDPRKALEDERPFVRANAAWTLQLMKGRKPVSRGPWVAAMAEFGDGVRWVFPEPTSEELEILKK